MKSSSYLQQLVPSYYDTLIRWDVLEEIVELVEEEDQPEVYKIIFYTLDHAILETVLLHLPKDHHTEFLELCCHQHHEPSLLMWLEDRSDGISEKIRGTIQQTKVEIRQTIL